MPEYLVNAKAAAYAEVYDLIKARIGAVEATKWMFNGLYELAGKSPVQAIREGEAEVVRILAEIA
jgi:hypothetical protein